MAMRHKQAFGLGFPLAILLVIGVIAWLTAGGGGSEVEATITPQTVCDSLVETDYDGSGIITLETAEGVRTARFEFNVSPPDSRLLIQEYYDIIARTYDGQSEYIRKDGVTYRRFTSSKPDTWNEWQVEYGMAPPLVAGGSSCLNPDASTRTAGERHFVWDTYTDDVITNTFDIWVDANGRPARGLSTFISPPEDGTKGPGEVSDSVEYRYSGFGNPNVITAPIDPPPSWDEGLSALDLSGVTLSPAFDIRLKAYTASVANDVRLTTVRPTTNDDRARGYVIRLGGVEDDDGTVSLAVGENVITVEVTAETGDTRTYTVTVIRDRP